MLEIIEMMLRYASTGLFLFLAILVLRDYGFRLAAILGFLSAMTASMYTVCTQPWYPGESTVFLWLTNPFCVMGPVNIWLFSLSQFQDNFRLNIYHWAGVVLYILLLQLNFSGWISPEDQQYLLVSVAFAAIRVFFIIHMLYVAWQGRADDLLENRKRFRLTFIILVGLYTTVIFYFETFSSSQQILYPYVSMIQAVSFFTLALVILWHATSIKSDILLVRQEKNESHLTIDDASDSHDLELITKLVQNQNLYKESGLTIAVLANKVGLPEHRLRRLINQHMGYRNFADFLNQHRIIEARRLLSDVDNRHHQILTIAMDLGYGSLGPFNRAFKIRTGKTPTAYRKDALSASNNTSNTG